MSALKVNRQPGHVVVADDGGGLVGHYVDTFKGRAYVEIALRANDELLVHNDMLEIYLDLERLSALHVMLGTFLEEARLLAKGGKDGAR